MKCWHGLSLFVAGALGGCVAGPHSPIHEATGATAQTLCNAAFVSRLDPARTLRQQLHAEPGMALVDWALRFKIDGMNMSVSASLLGGSRARSVYREGRGCTLVFSSGKPPEPLAAPPNTAAVLPEIAGPDVVRAVDPRMAAAIDAAFVEPDKGAARATQAVVVVHRGRVIAERYAPGITLRTPLDSHSLTKSVVNALIGILVRNGKIRLDQSFDMSSGRDGHAFVLRPTIAQLLRMSAGFGVDEGVGASIASRIWYEEADTAQVSVDSILHAPNGSGWGYCNRCYTMLSKVLGNAIGGGPRGLRDFAVTELFGPLGMRDVVPEFDQAGTLMGANAIFASPRDFARFGLLYLNDGIVGGHRILPTGWVGMSTRPTPGTGYGAGFWLNTSSGPMPDLPINWGLPNTPSDTFFARGHLGQYIVIVPSSDLVIVRMGQSHRRGAEMESVGRLTAEVISAIGTGE